MTGSAKRRGVLLAVEEIFFRVKLETALSRLGVPFRRAPISSLTVAARVEPPEVVILDLSDTARDPLSAVRELRAGTDLADLPVVGFASHVDRPLREAALRAGCNAVVTRGRVSAALSDVLAPFLGPRLGGSSRAP
jgi:CheY-like chemotaxis protein